VRLVGREGWIGDDPRPRRLESDPGESDGSRDVRRLRITLDHGGDAALEQDRRRVQCRRLGLGEECSRRLPLFDQDLVEPGVDRRAQQVEAADGTARDNQPGARSRRRPCEPVTERGVSESTR
jgi:hypothetical protein